MKMPKKSKAEIDFADSDAAEQVDISASIYEQKEGRNYGGFMKFRGLHDLFKYKLTFSRNLKKINPYLEKRPLDVLAITEFELRDCQSDKVIELGDYSALELIGLTVGGARSILAGRYDNILGVKMSFSITQIRRTSSIQNLMGQCAKEEKK